MTAKAILALSTGAVVRYRGKLGRIVDWKCNLEPTFAADGTRIDAEPVFRFSDNYTHTIHPAFWSEVSIPNGGAK